MEGAKLHLFWSYVAVCKSSSLEAKLICSLYRTFAYNDR